MRGRVYLRSTAAGRAVAVETRHRRGSDGKLAGLGDNLLDQGRE